MRHRLFFIVLVAAGFCAFAGNARASGDSGCSPEARFDHRQYNACSDRAVLSPGNDTRLNLMLLLADRGVAKPAVMAPNRDAYGSPEPAALLYWRALIEPEAATQPAGDAVVDASMQDIGYGRCVSNRRSQAAFVAALARAEKLDDEERRALVAARERIAASCGTPSETTAMLAATLARMRSAEGKAFAAYLMAAAVFYGDAPGAAYPAFATLAELRQPWVREAAHYMLARVDMNVAQLDAYTDYGSFVREKVDQASVQRARAGFDRYLKEYPRGAYADSARGLARRLNWLEGDGTRSAQAYIDRLSQPGTDTLRLLDEIDIHLLATDNSPRAAALATREPLLLAVDDLWRMRLDADDERLLGLQELAAQKSVFAGEPELYRYLQAVHAYYVQNKPARVLELLPETPPRAGMGYVAFSAQALRLQAMQLTGQPGVRAGWLRLWQAGTAPHQRAMAELMLAIHDEYAGQLDRVFAHDSRVRDAAIRRRLLQRVAGPEILAKQAVAADVARDERETALFVLLYRTLTRGRYAEFIGWQSRVPAGKAQGDRYSLLDPRPALDVFVWKGSADGYACPALVAIARTLQARPTDAGARLCLGEFLRLNDFDHFELMQPAGEYARRWQTDARQSRTLAGSPLLFPGSETNRQSIYIDVIADAKASRDDRAYALHRAVRCYAPSGSNDCGGEDVAPSLRRQWFNQLQRDYKDTRWARATPMYW